MWMVQQARLAGVDMDSNAIRRRGWDVVTNPIVHDSRRGLVQSGHDRWYRYLDGSEVDMRENTSVDLRAAEAFFDEVLRVPVVSCRRRNPRPVGCRTTGMEDGTDGEGKTTLRGMIHTAATANGQQTYQQWLLDNYGLDIEINHGEVSEWILDDNNRGRNGYDYGTMFPSPSP